MFRFLHTTITLLLTVLLMLSFHPAIMDVSEASREGVGTILSPYIVLVFTILFLISVVFFKQTHLMSSRAFKNTVGIFVFLSIWALLLAILFHESMMHEMVVIGMSIAALYIGWTYSPTQKDFVLLSLIWAGTSLFVCYLQIMVNNGGFSIIYGYNTDAKNQLGLVIASVAVLLFGLFMSPGQKRIIRVLFLITVVVCILFLLTIRARLSTLSAVLVMAFMYYCYNRTKNFLLYALLGIIVLFLVFLFLPAEAKQYIVNSFILGYEGGDITTGRIEGYESAWQILKEHPLEGNLLIKKDVFWAHNFLLYKYLSYGLVFVIPIYVMYFYLVWQCLRGALHIKYYRYETIGFFIMLVSFVSSLGEPTYPFGPGTATTMNFIYFGISLRQYYLSMKSKSISN